MKLKSYTDGCWYHCAAREVTQIGRMDEVPPSDDISVEMESINSIELTSWPLILNQGKILGRRSLPLLFDKRNTWAFECQVI